MDPENGGVGSRAIPPLRRAEPTIVYKPVVSASKAKTQALDPASTGRDPFIRAENEDDDGYDPYSDRVERNELFEDDPWR